jgi:glycosyltransferase involved in cell wall biosynthesis
MIEAAHILKDHKDIYFLVIGDGNEKNNLIKLSADNDHILFHEAVPKKAIPSILREMNVLCVGALRSNLYKYGVSPNKLIDYMVAGRPIVHYIESGFDIVADSKTGISTETENPQAIAKAILDIKAMKQSELQAIEKNGMDYVMKNHEFKVLSARYIEIMNKLRN